ncbi:hypothetical protein ACO0LG_23645 [Undibacterium sp. Ji42W]|uniref:hypothetical protein n=1 Tax=Undibacterium sp. Ji42W TaxID=3413039 RepID=UPI003BF0BF86
MKPAHIHNPDLSKAALCALVACHISVVLFFVTNAVLNQARFLNFWLPAVAFFCLYGYISTDDEKKLDIRAVTKEKMSLKKGVIVLFFLIFLLATKKQPLDFSDAFLLTILLAIIKDYLVDMLAMHQLAGKPDQQ